MAVGEDEQAGFFAVEKFLEYDGGVALREHRVERLRCLCLAGRDHHALARGEAVRLDDDGIAEGGGEGGLRVATIVDADIAGGRDVGAAAQILSEALRSFQLRGGLVGAEDGDAGGAQAVGKPVDQRRFGADHDQANGLRPHEIDHRGVIRRVEGDARRMVRDAGVAWRGIERIEGRRLRQFPRQCVFAAA